MHRANLRKVGEGVRQGNRRLVRLADQQEVLPSLATKAKKACNREVKRKGNNKSGEGCDKKSAKGCKRPLAGKVTSNVT